MKHEPKPQARRPVRFLRSGLFRRYAVTFSSLLLVSFFILGAAFLVTIAEFWTDEKLAQLSENAARVAERTEQTFRRYTDEERYAPVVMFMLSETASTLNTGLDEGAAPDQYIRMDIFVVNEEGQVVYCNDMYDRYLAGEPLACPLHQTATIPAELIQSAMHGAISGEDNLGGMFAQHRYFAAVPLKSGDGTTATGAVFATAPITEGLRPYIQQVVIRFIGATVLSILLVFVIIAYLSYRLTKPLLDMEQAASRYAVGDFSLRVYYRRKPKKPLKEKHKKRKHRHPDELIALVESFNNMAQDLSVLESTRRSFVANVSHELKTPMTTIGGFIDGILDGTIPPARQEHYLGIVSGEVKRLSRLVTGMLNMSRIEAGELHMKPKAFDLSELMLQTLLNFERLIDQKGVQVEGIDALGHVMISADRDMLSQVLYNLCDNAVKFVDGGGTIAVRVWEEEERIYATVRNSGTGIGQKDLSNVFERFYKVDQSRSYDTKSAGLGLYIVKTIIDLHGGKISAQSVESQYAEFKFWLPK